MVIGNPTAKMFICGATRVSMPIVILTRNSATTIGTEMKKAAEKCDNENYCKQAYLNQQLLAVGFS